MQDVYFLPWVLMFDLVDSAYIFLIFRKELEVEAKQGKTSLRGSSWDGLSILWMAGGPKKLLVTLLCVFCRGIAGFTGREGIIILFKTIQKQSGNVYKSGWLTKVTPNSEISKQR